MNKPVIIPNAQPNLVAVWVVEITAPFTDSEHATSPIVAWVITPEENEDPDTIDPDLCGRPICVAGYDANPDAILDTSTGQVWKIGSLLAFESLEEFIVHLRMAAKFRKKATP